LTPEPIRTADFDYDLPPELIAQEPLKDRAGSKLLVALRNDRRQGPADRRHLPRTGVLPRRISLLGARTPIGTSAVVDSAFAELPSLIAPGDLVILNTTKVRHARLLGQRKSGAPAEILLIHPSTDGSWIALGKPGSTLQPGKQVELGPGA
jgi:S-adenosylmethionine:tRNA ribosyltransferase-isomerase